MARHKQKDDEAGGEGLGVMETRKRMWRDANGNIVSKRPTLPYNAANRQKDTSPDYNGSANSNDDHNQFETQQPVEPLSPPRSTLSSSSGGRTQQQLPEPTIAEDVWSNEPLSAYSESAPDICDFLVNSSWGSQPSQDLAMGGSPYEDMFNPDTGKQTVSHLRVAVIWV